MPNTKQRREARRKNSRILFNYYLPDKVSVVIAENKTTGELSRGLSICSPMDTYSKKLGRKIAENRAVAGLADGASRPGSYIGREKLLNKLPPEFFCKVEFRPILTDWERIKYYKLVGRDYHHLNSGDWAGACAGSGSETEREAA
jgi:hypothetical protein